jgi:hypothetical protein
VIENRPQSYEIYEVTPTEWVLQVEGQRSFTGTLAEVGTLAVRRFDFSVSEIELAVEMMISKEQNAAHFGTNASLIYTFNKEKTHERKAG